MNSVMEVLSPTRVRIAVEIPYEWLKNNEIDDTVLAGAPPLRSSKFQPSDHVGDAPLPASVQSAITERIAEVIREHDLELKALGHPEVSLVEFEEGKPLRFTAVVDIRPEIALPELSSMVVEVDPVAVTREEIDAYLEDFRHRFPTFAVVDRPAVEGDWVEIDLCATVDGVEVEQGRANGITHEVGAGHLLTGLDEATVGMSAGQIAIIRTTLVGGSVIGKEAELTVTVNTVSERRISDLDDGLAARSGGFDTLDGLRADLQERLIWHRKIEQLYTARDKILKDIVAATDFPVPEGVLRDEVQYHRVLASGQPQPPGAPHPDAHLNGDAVEDALDTQLRGSVAERVRIQLMLDALADAAGIQAATDDEFSIAVRHRAQRACVTAQDYLQGLLETGMAESVLSDVRRGKALALIMESVTVKDLDGIVITFDDLSDRYGHEDHEHRSHTH